jgi:predicted alpha/beta-fold hydrolase
MRNSRFKEQSDLNQGYDDAALLQHYAGHAGAFVPRWFLRAPHLQTIASHVLPRKNSLPKPEQRLIHVEGDARVLCLCNWQADRSKALTVMLVHGLEGSSDSQYVVGTANKLWAHGTNVVRMNVRNCGGTESLCRTLYHSGMSSDIDAVVRGLIFTDKLERVALAGFSMGGNQVLKLAGEWGDAPPPAVIAVSAVSPAIDLSISADALHLPSNRIYEWRFLWSLRQRVRRKQKLFPGIFAVDRWWWRSIREFDDVVTAPHCGFRDAEDYYQQASASRIVDRISISTLIIHAKDDPFIRLSDQTRSKLAENKRIHMIETEHGGHCAFLASPDGYDGRWAELQLMNFFLSCTNTK